MRNQQGYRKAASQTRPGGKERRHEGEREREREKERERERERHRRGNLYDYM